MARASQQLQRAALVATAFPASQLRLRSSAVAPTPPRDAFAVLSSGPSTQPLHGGDHGGNRFRTGVGVAAALSGEAILQASEELQHLAKTRNDPERLRWRRLISTVVRSHGLLTNSQFAFLLAVLADNPVALASRSVRPLLDVAVDRFSLTPEGLTRGEMVAVASVLAHGRIHDDAAAATDLENAEEDVFGVSIGRRRMVPRFMARTAATQPAPTWVAKAPAAGEASTAAVRKLFWCHLAPRALGDVVSGKRDTAKNGGSAAELTGLLLALAMAWPSLPDAATHKALNADLLVVVRHLLDECLGLRPADACAHTQARLVGALGLLQSQGALMSGASDSSEPQIAQRILRSLEFERFGCVDLAHLLLLNLGLCGLGLGSSRLRRDAEERLAELTRSTAADLAPAQDVCRAVLLLHSCGRLLPCEPWALVLMQLAAGVSEKLKKGERKALRPLLARLAMQLSGGKVVRVASGANPLGHPTGSREAAICLLAQRDWFARKPTAEISWYRARGQLL